MPVDRDAGPLGDDAGDVVLGDGVVDQRVLPALRRPALRVRDFALQLRQILILQLRRRLVVVAALRVLQLEVQALALLLELAQLVDGLLLALEPRAHPALRLLEVLHLLAQLLQAVLTELVALLVERALLDLKLGDLAADVVQRRGHGVHLRADHGAGLVHEVDGLVGQEAVGDVAVGERRRGDEGVVVDRDVVEILVALLEAAEDGDGILHRRLIHLHGLEAALERGVLLNILAVLVERRGADAVQLAARQHGL